MAYLSQKTYIYTKISNTYTWTEVTDTNAWQSGELLTDFVERMNFLSINLSDWSINLSSVGSFHVLAI